MLNGAALKLGIAAALLIAAAAAGALAGYSLRGLQADAEISSLREDFAHQRRLAADAHASALRAALQRHADDTEALERIARDARTAAENDRRAAAVSAAAAARLREHIPRLIAAAASAPGADPAAAGGSQTAAAAELVLTDLYDWLDGRARDAAAALDDARRAGLACEQSYEAVRGPPT